MNNFRGDKFNASGYYDPTAYAAFSKIRREERQADKGHRAAKPPAPPRVYIASPYKGDTERNVRNALKYCRFAVEQGCFPIAPHCYLPMFMDDNNPQERALALSFGIRLLRGCRELWVFGDRVSEGMQGEIDEAKRCHIGVRNITDAQITEWRILG